MLQRFRSKKVLLIAVASILLVVTCSLLIGFIAGNRQQDTTSSAPNIQPDFTALLPANKDINELGGWQKLTPPNNAPYYVFNDAIDTIEITVSQQVLPDSFKSATSESIQDLAKSYSATDELDIDGEKAYIGTSTKGPQSVIFSKNGLLVLIKSQATIKNDAWKTYIKSLG